MSDQGISGLPADAHPEIPCLPVQGNSGIQGTTGVQGITGVWGVTGIAGITGCMGHSGPHLEQEYEEKPKPKPKRDWGSIFQTAGGCLLAIFTIVLSIWIISQMSKAHRLERENKDLKEQIEKGQK